MKTGGRRAPLQRLILRALVMGGALTVVAIAPNVIGALRQLDPALARQKNVRSRIQETLWRMQRNGLITLPTTSRGRVELLPKGEQLIERLEGGSYTIPKPLIWDGKWHVVMFDVAERRRRIRDELRTLLKKAGLYRLHDSVWVYPYSCGELVTIIKAHLKNVRGEIHYFSGDLLESDRYLREYFQLT